MTVGRHVDVSNLTEEEISKIISVISKDIIVRKSEKERRTYLNKNFVDFRREIYVANSKRKTRYTFDDYCLICGKHLFTFCCFSHRAEECVSCEHFCCNSCRKVLNDENDSKHYYLCDLCIHKRLLKCMTSEWFFELFQKRFKRFGSAKVLRAIYKQRKLIEPRVITLLALCRELQPTRFISVPAGIQPFLSSSQDDDIVSYSASSSNQPEKALVSIDLEFKNPRRRFLSESEVTKVKETHIDFSKALELKERGGKKEKIISSRTEMASEDEKEIRIGNLGSPKKESSIMEESENGANNGNSVPIKSDEDIHEEYTETLPLMTFSVENKDGDKDLTFTEEKEMRT